METAAIEQAKQAANNQAKAAILSILSDIGISKIVYVDDRCAMQELKEACIGKLKSLKSSNPDGFDEIDFTLAQAVFDKRINDLWDGKDDPGKRELFLNVLKAENNSEELENSVAPMKLKEILQDKIELLSPAEWVAQKTTYTSTLSDTSKILFLFDIQFTHAPLPDNRDGRHLASELLSEHTIKDYLYCGVFSHLFSIDEEHTKRKEYCSSFSIDPNRFYTISKKRYREDSYLPGLAEGIRNTLVIDEVQYLKKEVSKVLKESFKKSLEEIDNLTPESFNHIIQKSSLKEGAWEMSTLFRLSNIISYQNALNSLLPKTKRTKINESLSKIRKVEKVKTGSETPTDKAQVKELRTRELFLPEPILNQLHFPTSNGDIYRVNEREYILLAQPCNLALRSDGKRSRSYDIGFFIEIEKISLTDYQQLGAGQLGAIEKIENPNLPEGEIQIARFASFDTVSLIPLDLAVFNTNGKSTINLKELENKSTTIQDSWKKRYKIIHKQFSEYKKRIIVIRKLKASNKNLVKDAIYKGDLFKGFNINNENVLSRANSTILNFDIQRIGHYRQQYSSDLLQKFMQYLSRNAFDHDFFTKA